MSFIDDWARSIGELGGAIGAKVGAALDWAKVRSDVMNAAVDEVPVVGAINRATREGGAAVGNYMVDEYDAMWDEATTPLRTVNTAARLARQESIQQGGSWWDREVNEFRAFADPDTWGRAYDEAENLSLGQTVVDNYTVSAFRGAGVQEQAATATPEEWADYRKNSTGYNLLSGGYDFAARWYYEPGNVAGRAVEGFRAMTKVRPVQAGEDVKKAIEQPGKGATDIGARWESVKKFAFERPDSSSIYFGVEGVKEAKNGMALASALAKAARNEDPAEANRQMDLVGRVIYGDETAGLELKEKAAELADQIADANRQINHLNEAAKWKPIGGGKLRYFDQPQVEGEYAERLSYLKGLEQNLKAESDRLGELLTGDLDRAATAHTLRSTRRSQARARKAVSGSNVARELLQATETPTFFRKSMIRSSLWNVPVQLIRIPTKLADQALTMRGKGVVDLHAPDAVEELRHILDRPQMRDFDPVKRRELLSRFVDAPDEASRQRVLESADTTIIGHMAAKHGLDQKSASKLVNHYLQQKSTLLGRVRMYAGKTDQTAYSSAPSATDEGLTADTYLDEDGVVNRAPLLSTMLANKVPLVDVDLVDHVLKRNSNAMQATSEWLDQIEGVLTAKGLAMTVRAADKARWAVSELTTDFLQGAHRLWKFAMLTRLGYPIRNMIDGNARAWASAGGVMGQLYVEGTWNASKNAARWLTDKRGRLALKAHANDRNRLDELEDRLSILEAKGVQVQEVQARNDRLRAKLDSIDTLPESKVRDPKGNLRRVYHGTPNAFGEFSDDFIGSTTDQGWHGRGFYFAVDPEYASSYAGQLGEGASPNVRPAYLDIRKPWEWDDDVVPYDEIKKIAGRYNVEVPDSFIAYHAREGGEYHVRPREGMTMWEMQQMWNIDPIYGRGGPALTRAQFNEATREFLERKGFDGIHRRRGEEWPAEWIAFRSDQVKMPFEAESGEPILKGIEELTAQERALVDELGGMDVIQSEAAKLRERLADAESLGPDKVYKPERYTLGNQAIEYKGHTIPAPFPDGETDINAVLSSAKGITNRIISDGESSTLARSTATGDWVDISPGMPGHEEALLAQVNLHIRQDPITKMMIDGKSDREIVTWLRKTPEGKKLQRRLRWHAANKEEWIANIRSHFDSYLADPEWKEIVKTRQLTADDIKAFVDRHGKLPPVNGPQLQFVLGKGPMARGINRTMERISGFLGDAPETKFTRHPTYIAVYRKSWKQEFDRMMESPTRVKSREAADPDDIELLNKHAHAAALREVKRVHYDGAAHSNAAHTLRFLAPFMGAWEDGMRRWGMLLSEKPQIISYANLGWNVAPQSAGLVVDQNGNPISEDAPEGTEEYIAIKFPPFINKGKQWHFNGQAVSIPKSSFNIWFPGDPWWLPGAGPVVQFPVSAIASQAPEIEKYVKGIIPYGPNKDLIDGVLPAWLKRVRSANGELSDRAFSQDYAHIYTGMLYEWAEGGFEGPEPTEKDAMEATQGLYFVKANNNLLNAFPFQFKWKYQPIQDAYRQYTEQAIKEDRPQGWADQKLVEEYGTNSLILVGRVSQSKVGAQSTVEWTQAWRTYESILKNNRYAEPWISNVVGPEGEGAYSASAHQFNLTHAYAEGSTEKMRQYQNPAEAIKKTKANEGWFAYRQYIDMLDAVAGEAGLDSYQDSDTLTAARKDFSEKLAQDNPEWNESYNEAAGPDNFAVKYQALKTLDFDALAKRNPMRTDFAAVKQYIQLRDTYSEVLKEQHAEGLTGKANDDIVKAMFRADVLQLARNNTEFSRNWFNGDLEFDPMLEVEEG